MLAKDLTPGLPVCRSWAPACAGEQEGAGWEVAARARACLGARFRVHGRDPAFGLDCVGLAAVAFGREIAGDYPLRGRDAAAVAARIAAAGLVAADAVRAGDLLLIEDRGQLHLGIANGSGGCIHAHAGLRRVVESPVVPGRSIGCWREK